MVAEAVVRRDAYVDSVTLLQISATIAAEPGVDDAALVMGTELNRSVLRESGLLPDEAAAAGPNDLIIAARAADLTAVRAAIGQAEELLTRRWPPPGRGGPESAGQAPRTIRSALRVDPAATLALISVPGAFAAGEAHQALAAGLHVFLFSDNVSLADEVDLKRTGAARGLLVMGPDCGTAIVHGVGLGFANVVRAGRIGIVGASGTGIQEVTSLLHGAGEGISHALGTGGRDLTDAVDGSSTRAALALLGSDPATEVIVLLAKPSSPRVAAEVLQVAAATGKRIVACLLGYAGAAPAGVELVTTLEAAARQAAPGARWPAYHDVPIPTFAWRADQEAVHGYFCGGTLAAEAELCLDPVPREVIDFGDDRYTRGRAHPMLDPSLRNHAIAAAGANARVAVLLLDVILGRGAHPDPAGAIVPAIQRAMAAAASDGRHLAVLAHVVGTAQDPQGLDRQAATLEAAGVLVLPSNVQAARLARALVRPIAERCRS